jgi:hypothetical protein
MELSESGKMVIRCGLPGAVAASRLGDVAVDLALLVISAAMAVALAGTIG